MKTKPASIAKALPLLLMLAGLGSVVAGLLMLFGLGVTLLVAGLCAVAGSLLVDA